MEKSNLWRKSKEMWFDVFNGVIVFFKLKWGLVWIVRRKRWEWVCGWILMCRVFFFLSLKIVFNDYERVFRFIVSVSKFFIFFMGRIWFFVYLYNLCL